MIFIASTCLSLKYDVRNRLCDVIRLHVGLVGNIPCSDNELNC